MRRTNPIIVRARVATRTAIQRYIGAPTDLSSLQNEELELLQEREADLRFSITLSPVRKRKKKARTHSNRHRQVADHCDFTLAS